MDFVIKAITVVLQYSTACCHWREQAPLQISHPHHFPEDS